MDKAGRFTPRLDILPLPQRRLWDELASVPPEFVLYGGTAIALHALCRGHARYWLSRFEYRGHAWPRTLQAGAGRFPLERARAAAMDRVP